MRKYAFTLPPPIRECVLDIPRMRVSFRHENTTRSTNRPAIRLLQKPYAGAKRGAVPGGSHHRETGRRTESPEPEMNFREWADETEPRRDGILSGCCVIVIAFLFASIVFCYAICYLFSGEESAEVHPEAPGIQNRTGE